MPRGRPKKTDTQPKHIGRPIEIDREETLRKLNEYIDNTEVPIIAEFAYMNGLHKQRLYDIEAFSDAIKRLICKKEAALDRKAQNGEINTTFAIFSLKQLGWRDNQDISHSGTVAYKVIPDKDT